MKERMMNAIKVFVESGQKKIFAGAVDWPGWCRYGRDEDTALQALVDYGPRYAQVVQGSGIAFQVSTSVSDLVVADRHAGSATTDFGAPAIILDADDLPLAREEFTRLHKILEACWEAFDEAVHQAADRALRKGPRGGGRDVEKILDHVLEANCNYLAKLAWKHKRESVGDPVDEIDLMRGQTSAALDAAVNGELPAQLPRGGSVWPPRYFIRRAAWHVLDHAWEIDDRIL